MMRQVFERPPLFALINEKFHIIGKPVIFAWGSIIYNPMGVIIPPELLAHEAVHGARQKGRIEEWWKAYCASDPRFRLAEEVLAHRVEYKHLLGICDNRQARRGYIKRVAKRLASPLYGRMVTMAQARQLILEAT